MNAEEEKERRDGDDCGIILSSSYSFLSERCASPKAALLSFVCGGRERENFWVFCWGVKSLCWTHPDDRFSRFFLFLLRERSA